MNSDLPSAVLKVRARLARPSALLAEVHAATARVVALRDHAEKPSVSADAIRVALQELERAQEELCIAQDYLHAQADEMSSAATALEAQRRYYEELFRAAPEACLITDAQGEVLDANRRAQQLLQVDFGLLPRRRLGEFLSSHETRRVLELLQNPAPDASGRCELTFSAATGAPIPLQASVARVPHPFEGSTRFQWLLRPAANEATALRQCQSKLDGERRSHALAKAALLENQSLLRMVAHELRTPLSAIMGWTEILNSKRADAFGIERIVSGLRQSAFMLARTLEDLVDDARAARGQLTLEVCRLSLPDLVERVLDEQRDNAELRDVRMSAILDRSLPSVDADPFRLEQVIGNLLESALKFTDLGGALQVRLARRGGFAELSVHDSSQPMTSEPLVSVCDAFVQVQRAGDAGLGIGLDFARRIVELHGGTFGVAASGSGRSATFTVRLPLRRGTEARAHGEQPS